jgi:hypothetical protein
VGQTAHIFSAKAVESLNLAWVLKEQARRDILNSIHMHCPGFKTYRSNIAGGHEAPKLLRREGEANDRKS